MRHDPVRLYIFDADDTLRRTLVPGQPAPRAPSEWELLPGVADRLRSIPWGDGGARLGVASNQDQVGYGLLSEPVARQLLADMIAAATGFTPPRTAIALCPHRIDVRCHCRKPAPGMLLGIMAFYHVPAARTLVVGNAPADREAASRAGARFMWAHDFFEWSDPPR